MFDSQIKRQDEENQAKSLAGLSAFKATGNPMQDAFRRMIEKKLYEQVQNELAKAHEKEETLKREVEVRTAAREKQIEAEKLLLIKENDIKLQTAQEAREDAEDMAKVVTVGSMVAAASQTGIVSSDAEGPFYNSSSLFLEF